MNYEGIHQDHLAKEQSALQLVLVEIRRGLGFKSARAFYDQYLLQRARIDFNYSYFMKIEGGKIIPSAQVIANLGSALQPESADRLTLAYCASLFPERSRLFNVPKKIDSVVVKNHDEKAVASQTCLTPAQIVCVVRTKAHYFIFLLLTLARRPLETNEVIVAFGGSANLNEEELEKLLIEMVRVKLIRMQDHLISSIATEMKFPPADEPMLKSAYRKMDAWGTEFYEILGFEPLMQKMMLRRVSPRYLAVIHAHCNVLLDLIRASDEVEAHHNNSVLMLNLSIQRGELPG